MASGSQQRCQESELPLEVPAGELSHLQVHVVHPSVSQAEAQELRQVRPVDVNDSYSCDICIFNFRLYVVESPFVFRNVCFDSSIPTHI